MDAVLGFAVLTGPLWLILILLIVAGWGARKVMMHFNFGEHGIRMVIRTGTFLLIFLVSFGDEIAGRIYHNYLCSNKAGVKVYQTVELPAEYWDERGKAKFYDERNGNFKLEGYRVEYKSGEYSSSFHIENAGYQRIDNRSGKVLGEAVNFMHWGGWLRRNFVPNNVAATCEGGIERSDRLIKQIFKPKKS